MPLTEDATLVAFGICQYDPWHVTLADADIGAMRACGVAHALDELCDRYESLRPPAPA